MAITIKHTEEGKFQLFEDDKLATEIDYISHSSQHMSITHTITCEGFTGKGYAKQLALACVEHARANGIKITPKCSYIKSLYEKTPEIADTLHGENFE